MLRSETPLCTHSLGRHAHFTCRDSTYFERLLILCCTSLSCPPATERNKGPQIGISLEPWAGRLLSPRRVEEIFNAGYLPPLFLARTVRSGGVVLSAAAAGPAPLPSVPWQVTQ